MIRVTLTADQEAILTTEATTRGVTVGNLVMEYLEGLSVSLKASQDAEERKLVAEAYRRVSTPTKDQVRVLLGLG